MWRRGANLEGDVANFIETEQVVEVNGLRSSLLQVFVAYLMESYNYSVQCLNMEN